MQSQITLLQSNFVNAKEGKVINMSENTLVLKENYLRSDTDFNELYPPDIQMLARRHWTQIDIAQQAATFLACDGGKILDIGSGVGKFCLAAAYYAPHAQFFGVEQRKYLINHALRAQQLLGVPNATFINANFTQLDLQEYDHFYFFNSFYENLDDMDRIDENIAYSEGLYEYYVRYLYKCLDALPAGTKIATYHSLEEEIPGGYELVGSHSDNNLRFWKKR